MKTKLWFKVDLGFMKKEEYKKLIKLGFYSGLEKAWYFALKDLSKVIEITGQLIEFEEAEARTVIEYCPPLKQIVDAKSWKGIGKLMIIETPKYYVCREWRKDKEGEVKEINHTIPRETVLAVWNTIKSYPIKFQTRTRRVARDYCVNQHVTDYIVDGRFDFPKFFGTRSKGYFPFYYSLRILEELGVIEYEATGVIIRLADNLGIEKKEVKHDL